MSRSQNQFLMLGYAWYEHLGYRFFWVGPIALQCFTQINTK